LMGGQHPATGRAHRLLHPLPQQRQCIFCDGPSLTCLPHPRDNLLPAECLGRSAALLHDQRRGFHRREPACARRTSAPTSDGGAGVGGTAIKHATVLKATERTMHTIPPFVYACLDSRRTSANRLMRHRTRRQGQPVVVTLL